MSVSERIKSRRKELNLSVSELARRAGFNTRAALANYEYGVRKPSADAIIRLSKVLGVSPAWLHYGVGKKLLKQREK